MQRQYLKFVGCFLILSIIFNIQVFSQTSSYRLRTADSLFSAKKYTQSLEHYEEMLKQDQYTPAMLLKMAYIEEGLLNIGQSMYYLNLYFLATNDQSTLVKMDELAKKYNLEGYEPTVEQFFSFYHENFNSITMAIAALIVLALAGMFYTRFSVKRRPIDTFILLIFLMLGFGAHVIFGPKTELGIVTSRSAYIMSGPSAAAQVVEIVGDGHRVEVLGHKDVWLKINWEGEVAYIKQNMVLPVQL
jgi:hypothetical protein